MAKNKKQKKFYDPDSEPRYYTLELIRNSFAYLNTNEEKVTKYLKKYIPIKDFKGLPSVTSIAKYSVDKSGPLMGWAIKETINFVKQRLDDIRDGELELTEELCGTILAQARKQTKELSDTAKNYGSLAHEAIELINNGKQLNGKHKRVKPTIDAFTQWAQEVNFQPIYNEIVVVSRKHDFAGRIDAVGYVNGILAIIDYKTAKSIYDDHRVQIAGGYMTAYNEMAKFFGLPIAKAKYILRLPKEKPKKKVEKAFDVEPIKLNLINQFLAAKQIFHFNHQ